MGPPQDETSNAAHTYTGLLHRRVEKNHLYNYIMVGLNTWYKVTQKQIKTYIRQVTRLIKTNVFQQWQLLTVYAVHYSNAKKKFN